MEENITTYWYIAEADSNGNHTLKDPQCEGPLTSFESKHKIQFYSNELESDIWKRSDHKTHTT